MKKYKTGDTIYVKGKVKAIDDTTLPYGVDFGNGNNFIDFESGTVWVTSDNMIDELPTAEPVKPVLPKGVADEMSYVKSFDGVTFDGYIVQIINGNSTYKNSRALWISSSDGIIKTLMDAWNNGYTVAKEKKYNVKVPYAYDSYFYKVDDGYCDAARSLGVCLSDDRFRFTDAEIEHYGLQDCEKEEVKQ